LQKSITFQEIERIVDMEKASRSTFRSQNSLTVALELLKTGIVQSYVTSCNTGALVTGAVHALKMLPGFKRPALAVRYQKKYPALLLDVGAFIEASKEQLISQALLGVYYLLAAEHRVSHHTPRVGLLNIGQESYKGSVKEQETFKRLQAISKESSSSIPHFQFIGNVEPYALFDEEVDIIVTSGMFGNICLKTVEACQKYYSQQRPAGDSNINTPFSPRGALLLGVNGHIVKCHGAATGEELAHAGFQAATDITTIQYMKEMLLKKAPNYNEL
jgi:glycerol-3-phosphate acyltransferase PlsX